jgi:hypothetical protein
MNIYWIRDLKHVAIGATFTGAVLAAPAAETKKHGRAIDDQPETIEGAIIQTSPGSQYNIQLLGYSRSWNSYRHHNVQGMQHLAHLEKIKEW